MEQSEVEVVFQREISTLQEAKMSQASHREFVGGWM
jgi:hypothetical protein